MCTPTVPPPDPRDAANTLDWASVPGRANVKPVRFTRHEMKELNPPRELTAHERATIRTIGDATSDAAVVRCQLDRASVSAACVDRCGTIGLIVSPGGCPRLSSAIARVGEGVWREGKELTQTVLLFADEGLLVHLETYRHDGEVPTGLPPVDELPSWAG
jgi:hypothetical protein